MAIPPSGKTKREAIKVRERAMKLHRRRARPTRIAAGGRTLAYLSVRKAAADPPTGWRVFLEVMNEGSKG